LASKEVRAAGVGNLGLQDRVFFFPLPNVQILNFALERLALRWIQKYITAFGGDPTKVTMYATALATSLDYVETREIAGANLRVRYLLPFKCWGTEATRRVSSEPVSWNPAHLSLWAPSKTGRSVGLALSLGSTLLMACLKDYDQIVSQTGCSGASDTLACLRTVPFATLKAAQDATPGIFAYQVKQTVFLVELG
jgi:hypothetical protein